MKDHVKKKKKMQIQKNHENVKRQRQKDCILKKSNILLWRFFNCSVFLEFNQFFFDAFQRIGEISIIEFWNLLIDPVQ